MDSSSSLIRFLAGVRQFSAMAPGQLTRLYGFTALKVLAKGEAGALAGEAVDELRIVVSGRLAEHGKGPQAQACIPLQGAYIDCLYYGIGY